MQFFALAGESYRKVRNTLRFMLSNLDDFPGTPALRAGCLGTPVLRTGSDPSAHTPSAGNPGTQQEPGSESRATPTSLDAWILGEYNTLAAEVLAAYERYDFRSAYEQLYNFCNATLSAVYLTAVKDRLYCDKPDSPRRRGTQRTLWQLTDGLCRLLAPILCHTADEAYRALLKTDPKDTEATVHTRTFIESFPAAPDPGWPAVLRAMEAGTKALEQAKQTLGVENRLDAGVVLPDADGTLASFDPTDLADILGVSLVTADKNAAEARVTDLRHEHRCDRSWKRDGTVKKRADGGMLSDRDAAAIGVG